MADLQTQIEQLANQREASRPQAIPTATETPLTINFQGRARILPVAADDLDDELYLAVSRRMESEYAIASSLFVLTALVGASGYSLGTALEEPGFKATAQEKADYEEAESIRLYNERCLQRFETPMMEVVAEACEAWGDGHKLFEVVNAVVTDDDGTESAQIVALKPKPRENYRLVVTRNMDLLGAIPGNGGSLWVYQPEQTRTEGDRSDRLAEFVGAEDLFIVTMRPRNGDPRGRGAKRAAYDPWNRKQRAKPEALKHATLFGSGRISIEGPEPKEGSYSGPKKVMYGGKEMDLMDYMAQVIGPALTANSFVFLPDGWREVVHPPQGDGRVFENIFDRCDTEMKTAILGVNRATEEATNGSKADSETALGLLAVTINHIKTTICEAFRRQVLYRNTALKFGEDAARRFTPKLLMAAVEDEDRPALLTALATAYAAGVVTPEQLPYWDREVGQPERDLEETIRKAQDDDRAKAEAELEAAAPSLNSATTEKRFRRGGAAVNDAQAS